MIAPKGPRAMHKSTRFFSRDHRNTHGYWAEYLFYLHTCNRLVLRSCPERSLQSPPFAPHPPPLSDGNLHPTALLRIRGNYFRPYLSISACAIEVQHSNENSTTIVLSAILNSQAGCRCTLVPRLPFPVPRSPLLVPVTSAW